MTVVAQWAKALGIHCYIAGSIPAVTPRYCTKKIEKCSLEHKKTKEKKMFQGTRQVFEKKRCNRSLAWAPEECNASKAGWMRI